MSQKIFAGTIFPRRVPRRTAFFLLVYNNFQYLVIVPILALIIFLDLQQGISIILSVLAILGVAIFWNAYDLNNSLKSAEFPHHQRWEMYHRIFSPFARVIRDRSAWQFSLLGLVLINVPLLIVSLPSLIHPSAIDTQPGLGFDLYWLAYIPFLIWTSNHTHLRNSEWFGALWLFSALFYTFCFLMVYRGSSPPPVGRLSLLMIWFFFLSALVHYLIRRIAILRGQAELLQAVTARLRDDRRYTKAFDTHPVQSTPDVSLSEIAEHIGTMLFYDRVFILVRDPKQEELFMKGRYGIHVPWPKTGWSIQEKQSITGWVTLNKESHLCADTNRCSLFFNPEEAYSCRSEATVPILAEDECVGVIDIESGHANAFNQSDIRLLWQVANAIGAALSYERHVSKEVDKAHRLLEQASEILIQSKNLDEALQKVAQKIREIFRADLIVLYKHAVTTCVPLPGLIIDGEPLHPNLLGRSIREDSRVNELLRKPEGIYVQPMADEDALLLGPHNGNYNVEDAQLYGSPHRFVRREKIKSVVYIRLGLGNDIVGSLFLNYRRPMDFQPKMIESLQAFANVLTMGLILKRQMERAAGPLAGTIPLAHSTAEAAFESVSRDFDEIDWDQIRRTSQHPFLLKQIRTYREKLEALRSEWKNLILVEHVNLQRSSMVEPITQLETKLHSMFPNVSFKWDSREFLDIPTDELGEVIYKVIAEGVSNALVHAHADQISIQGKTDATSITVRVVNNGEPMVPEKVNLMNNLVFDIKKEPDKPTGIRPILLDARRWFGAEWNFSINAVNQTLLTVLFPLETIEEKEEYLDENEA